MILGHPAPAKVLQSRHTQSEASNCLILLLKTFKKMCGVLQCCSTQNHRNIIYKITKEVEQNFRRNANMVSFKYILLQNFTALILVFPDEPVMLTELLSPELLGKVFIVSDDKKLKI